MTTMLVQILIRNLMGSRACLGTFRSNWGQRHCCQSHLRHQLIGNNRDSLPIPSGYFMLQVTIGIYFGIRTMVVHVVPRVGELTMYHYKLTFLRYTYTCLLWHYFHFQSTFESISLIVGRVQSQICNNARHKTIPDQQTRQFVDSYLAMYITIISP